MYFWCESLTSCARAWPANLCILWSLAHICDFVFPIRSVLTLIECLQKDNTLVTTVIPKDRRRHTSRPKAFHKRQVNSAAELMPDIWCRKTLDPRTFSEQWHKVSSFSRGDARCQCLLIRFGLETFSVYTRIVLFSLCTRVPVYRQQKLGNNFIGHFFFSFQFTLWSFYFRFVLVFLCTFNKS